MSPRDGVYLPNRRQSRANESRLHRMELNMSQPHLSGCLRKLGMGELMPPRSQEDELSVKR
eukprot:scaffold496756_cov39-Prasinocladus_malaysianus.AAC.1